MPSLFICSVLVLCSILKLVKSEDLQNCMTLTRENYYDELKSNNFFVMFYTDNCGICTRWKPSWNEMCEKYKSDESSGVKIGVVDCVSDRPLCLETNIAGVPTYAYIFFECTLFFIIYFFEIIQNS